MDSAGRTVIITGGGSGIGARTAAAFDADGASVIIVDIDGDAAASVAASLTDAVAITADVSSPEALREMADAVIERFGRIDVLVNNALSVSDAPFLETTPDEVRRDIDVSLLGPIFASQIVLPHMIEQGGGVILNVSSVNGLAYFGNDAYSAAKAGLISLTRSIASQFGQHGIRCNAVAPGTVATAGWDERVARDPLVFERAAQWYPLGRIGTPADIANALLFLASDAAAWISGVTLPVDGGLMTGNVAMARGLISGPDDGSVGADA